MVQFKLNVSEKNGKTVQKELTEEESIAFIGKKIRDTFSGDSVGYSGYEFEITGGSDKSGVPMRSDNPGIARKRILTVACTIGFRRGRDGMKKRRLVAGNTISEQTVQINAKVVKAGKKPLVEEPEPESTESENSEAVQETSAKEE